MNTGKVVDLLLNDGWVFHKVSDSNLLPAKVPGDVISDLLRNKVIPDPYFRSNEKTVQWVEKEDWEYFKTFNVSEDVLRKDVVELFFEGLDTYSDVFLNDSLVLKSNNMFRSWKIDCKLILKPKANHLRIRFHSPVKEGMDRQNKLPYQLPIEDEQAPLGERTSVFTRKASYQYGWEGGPRLVTSGIWRPVHLLAWSDAKIENIYFKPIQVSSKLAIYNTEVTIRSTKDEHMRLELIVNKKSVIGATDVVLKNGLTTQSLSFTINDPKLWWPNGLGKPTLYDLTICLKHDKEMMDVKKEKLGVRKIELIQQADSFGSSFYFKVNDVPVFMKGANYVPSDIISFHRTPQKLTQLITSVQNSNMNMIRVWGGGIYEDESFYDLCDENGILIWQDFMFSSSMQPGDRNHLENIKKEAEDNIKRLRNHACLALWCGNSEILENWTDLNWKNNYSKEIGARLWNDYNSIFKGILPESVSILDPTTAYIASTPQGSKEKDSGIFSGDQHDWSVWYNGSPIEDYEANIGRFVSEFGMQSYPSIPCLKEISIASDLTMHSEILKQRQRNTVSLNSVEINGNDMIDKYCTNYFKETKDFETLDYLSQVMQSEALKKAIESHRCAKPHCMGTLYWQLNDCWPTISWSTIDYYNHWKLSQYTVSDAFAPIVVVPVRENDFIYVYGISDVLRETEAILLARLIDFQGKTLYVKQIPVKIAANSSDIIMTISESKMMKGIDKKNCCLVVQLNQPNSTLAQNILYFSRPRDLSLQKATIDIGVNEAVSGFNLILKSAVLVKNVGLETRNKKCVFSDNNFDLLPGKRTKVNVHYEGTREELLKDLKVHSVNNY